MEPSDRALPFELGGSTDPRSAPNGVTWWSEGLAVLTATLHADTSCKHDTLEASSEPRAYDRHSHPWFDPSFVIDAFSKSAGASR